MQRVSSVCNGSQFAARSLSARTAGRTALRETDTQKALQILEAINLEDSDLFGFSVDPFKIRLLISAGLSSRLEAFKLNPIAEDLCFDFRLLGGDGFNVRLARGPFGPPYSNDGELLANDLSSFTGITFNLRECGGTEITERWEVERARVPVYEIEVHLFTGSIQFQFCDVRMSTFSAEDFDSFK